MILLTLLSLTTAADPVCTPQRPMTQVVTRASKYDSASTTIGGAIIKVCYGRPLMNGRTIFGSTMVPYGKLWRTGANEPTIIHTTGTITVAGVTLEAGSYSLYTIPKQGDAWEIIINRSISQWGHEGSYGAVSGQELGRGKAPAAATTAPVETFTIALSPTAMTLSWERTKVTIPVGSAK